jgi:hypothetical protein
MDEPGHAAGPVILLRRQFELPQQHHLLVKVQTLSSTWHAPRRFHRCGHNANKMPPTVIDATAGPVKVNLPKARPRTCSTPGEICHVRNPLLE